MNIKEGSIFVWDQATFDLLLKSNLFNYIHVRLSHDKEKHKHLLQMDLVENKKFSFVPSISKSFNSLFDFCMNVTFGYLHSINYGDKLRLKFFKNLSYKNNKHDYDMVFVNDTVELEKLRSNSPAYFIWGVNVSQAFKKELDSSALSECVNIMNRQGENGEKKGSINVQGGFNHPGKCPSGKRELLPSGSSPQRKNIYSYLNRGKVFLFAIRKIRNTVLEIKVKAKKELFHNFLYFLKEKKYHSEGPTHSGRLFPSRFLSFWRSPNDSEVLSNQLYNIYRSKLKLSSCLNAYSSSWFEKSKFMKSFFNVKNKMDLVFYFNTDRRFDPTGEGNSSVGGTDGSKADLKTTMLSFFKQANRKRGGGFLSLDQIKNVYLNYTFSFQKNYRVNMFDFFCKLKRVLTYRGGSSRGAAKPLATGEEAPLVLVPLYKCKLIMNQVHLLLNVAFFFKRGLWDLRQGYNCLSSWGWGGGERNGKGPWSYCYHQVKGLFRGNRARTGKRDGPNFDEDLTRITLPSGDTTTGSSPPNSTTYNVCNVNLNDAQKEQESKINLTMNYKLILPVLFENYFLNLMDLRLYLFLNCSLFGIGGSSGSSSTSSSDSGGGTPRGGKPPNAMSEDSRKSALYNYLKLSFLKNKRKMHHSAFGLGLLLSNINIFFNFQIGRHSLLPSLVLQLDEGTSRFGYLSTNPSGNLDETYIRQVLSIPKEDFQNEDIIIKQTVDKGTEEMINQLLEHLNVEYQMRYYYLFLNYYLTMQTLFMSPLIDLTSEELKKIVNKIVHIKRMTYPPVTIYDVLSFQYSSIAFFKSSHDNLASPVKKVKLVGETIERGGIPTTFSKKVIMKDVISANISLKEKYNKVKRHNEGNFGGRYKARNYYDSSRR
ncbi:hypothetical protein PCYB_146020 [Plasmodium cynomolgi strain B]|uniref:Uncharacterized protein n=1 Tax=Plasmodium cynomolgi (strain B) TaxID=1120755 RepID=K6UN53_PLACD|nr:hypothetical protein PCYB_146020 [Plasmodium cynomolgi strain B]GAB69173.1 hypothetical protein PCYB_146020 [Plasmodium cynomolgi strain B]